MCVRRRARTQSTNQYMQRIIEYSTHRREKAVRVKERAQQATAAAAATVSCSSSSFCSSPAIRSDDRRELSARHVEIF